MFVINETGNDLVYSIAETSGAAIITSANLTDTAVTKIDVPPGGEVTALGSQISVPNNQGVKVTTSMEVQSNFTTDNTCLWEYHPDLTAGSWIKVAGSSNCDKGNACVLDSVVNSDYPTGHPGQFLYLKCVADFHEGENGYE